MDHYKHQGTNAKPARGLLDMPMKKEMGKKMMEKKMPKEMMKKKSGKR
jgi:hypothetical protein